MSRDLWAIAIACVIFLVFARLEHRRRAHSQLPVSAVSMATAIWLGVVNVALIGSVVLAVDHNYGGAVIVAAAGLLILAGGVLYGVGA